jgi:hypothetical protein
MLSFHVFSKSISSWPLCPLHHPLFSKGIRKRFKWLSGHSKSTRFYAESDRNLLGTHCMRTTKPFSAPSLTASWRAIILVTYKSKRMRDRNSLMSDACPTACMQPNRTSAPKSMPALDFASLPSGLRRPCVRKNDKNMESDRPAAWISKWCQCQHRADHAHLRAQKEEPTSACCSRVQTCQVHGNS